MSEVDIHGYFPIEWNFGKSACDGRRGPPCYDPSLIRIVANDEELGTLSLAEMIRHMISGARLQDGTTGPDHVWSLCTVRDFLRVQANMIDEALK